MKNMSPFTKYEFIKT